MRAETEETPQIADIRSLEAIPYKRAFGRWWDIVWERQMTRGVTESTFCPEFGPPPNLPTMPGSGKPVAILSEMCDWQKDRHLDRFRVWSTTRKGSSHPMRIRETSEPIRS
jgi:hypothetical protein